MDDLGLNFEGGAGGRGQAVGGGEGGEVLAGGEVGDIIGVHAAPDRLLEEFLHRAVQGFLERAVGDEHHAAFAEVEDLADKLDGFEALVAAGFFEAMVDLVNDPEHPGVEGGDDAFGDGGGFGAGGDAKLLGGADDEVGAEAVGGHAGVNRAAGIFGGVLFARLGFSDLAIADDEGHALKFEGAVADFPNALGEAGGDEGEFTALGAAVFDLEVGFDFGDGFIELGFVFSAEDEADGGGAAADERANFLEREVIFRVVGVQAADGVALVIGEVGGGFIDQVAGDAVSGFSGQIEGGFRFEFDGGGWRRGHRYYPGMMV